MKFFPVSLTLALSILRLAQAGAIEDHGYQIKVSGEVDSVLSRDSEGDYQLIDVISFHPRMNLVTIFIANNDLEAESENKLSLGCIYTSLAEKRSRKPEDIDWVVSKVDGDPETDMLIRGIRQDREVGVTEDITVRADDKEWKAILDTKYYKNAAAVNNKAIEAILIRTVQHPILEDSVDIDSFYFHFPTKGIHNPEDNHNDEPIYWAKELKKGFKTDEEGDWEDEEDEGAAMRNLFAEEEEQQSASLETLFTEIDDMISEAVENDQPPASRR
ncbi:hypothetical protein Cpir12675_006974 [Ceratocystis pirilliformis]|uniref:Uncharacterized protein n=1 Tax=Ceratocystis pirilliformis TaxID=259994 RepID=A0ABR3YDB5_9PEZI